MLTFPDVDACLDRRQYFSRDCPAVSYLLRIGTGRGTGKSILLMWEPWELKATSKIVYGIVMAVSVQIEVPADGICILQVFFISISTAPVLADVSWRWCVERWLRSQWHLLPAHVPGIKSTWKKTVVWYTGIRHRSYWSILRVRITQFITSVGLLGVGPTYPSWILTPLLLSTPYHCNGVPGTRYRPSKARQQTDNPKKTSKLIFVVIMLIWCCGHNKS